MLIFLQWVHIDPMVLLRQLFSFYQSRVKAGGGGRFIYTKNRYSFTRSAVISELSASRAGRFSAVKVPVIPTEHEAVWVPEQV
jgi:hypothetical protein